MLKADDPEEIWMTLDGWSACTTGYIGAELRMYSHVVFVCSVTTKAWIYCLCMQTTFLYWFFHLQNYNLLNLPVILILTKTLTLAHEQNSDLYLEFGKPWEKGLSSKLYLGGPTAWTSWIQSWWTSKGSYPKKKSARIWTLSKSPWPPPPCVLGHQRGTFILAGKSAEKKNVHNVLS